VDQVPSQTKRLDHEMYQQGLYGYHAPLNMQVDMINAYNSFGNNIYQSVHTPVMSYPASPSSPWVTTNTTSAAGVEQKVEGKKYRHNPYASAPPSESATPPMSPLLSASHNGIFVSDSFAAMPDPAAPVYDPSFADSNVAHPVANSLEDQFSSIIGMIAATACTARGRTLLLNIIRMQHLDKIQQIFEELCASFGTVIADPHGCHVLRFIIEYVQEPQLDLLMGIMTPELAFEMCTLSQHSRRVLQCLVEQHKTHRLLPLVEAVCSGKQAIAIAKTQQGCIAIMRLLENVLSPMKDLIFRSIFPCFAELSVDQFGNYTIQTAIQQYDRHMLSATLEHNFHGRFVEISCNKFGSNVMEKVVQAATPSLLSSLLNELCYEPGNLHRLMHDGFGNFVIQAIVEVTAGTPEGRRLCDTIRPLLSSSPYGHKIEAKLRSKRLLGSAVNEVNISNSNSGASASICGDR
jgi:hypothetical protein